MDRNLLLLRENSNLNSTKETLLIASSIYLKNNASVSIGLYFGATASSVSRGYGYEF